MGHDRGCEQPPDWFTNDIVSVSGWIDSCWTDSVSGVFEGAIESRTYGAWTGFKGDISLNTGSGSINADQYTMLSLAGVSLNPNVSTTEYGCGMFLLWKDSTETERQLELHGSNGFDQWLGNGREMWREFGSFDLSGVPWWGGEISDLRIRFQMDSAGSFPGSSLGIRIGWVRLGRRCFVKALVILPVVLATALVGLTGQDDWSDGPGVPGR